MNVYVKLRPQIIRNLTEIDYVLDCLLYGDHITVSNYENIRLEKDELDKIREMLKILTEGSCPPQTFVKILSKTRNESLEKQFQEYLPKMEREVVEEKPMPQARDKRKVFILEGLEQDEILHKCFSERNPDWDVSTPFGSINKLMKEICSIPVNQFSYFDIIVSCDEEGNHITNESLKTILPCIEKELLPEFPPSIITFLIIVDGNDDNDYVFHSDTKPVSFRDAKIRKPVLRILKTKFLHGFLEAFFKSDESFDIFIAKKFDLENNFMKNKLSEGKTDKRKIFILEGLEQDEKLHKHFPERNPDWDVSFILYHESLMEQITSIPLNEFSYFDIIVLCDEEGNHITNESLETILPRIEKELLPKFPPSIIAFLIIIDGNDDNGYVFHSDTKPVSFGDAQIPKPVFRIVKKNIFEDYIEAFFRHEEMFNIFIAKKLDLENNFMKNNPSEGKTDKRKIFIVEGLDVDEKLHECFSRKNPDWEVSTLLGSINKLKENIVSIPENQFSYFDIIVSCDEEGNHITNKSLKTILLCIEKEILPEFPPSIITFLIIVDGNDDNGYVFHSDTKPVSFGDAQIRKPVLRILKTKFLHGFLEAFLKSEETFNIFIDKKFLSEKSLVDKKPVEETTDKRKIFIMEGLVQNEILSECFSGSNPDWEVSTLWGSINKLMKEIASIPENMFIYIDIIVLYDEEGNHITNESLKTILPYIEKELLPKFPPSIITLLIIVNDEETESKPVQESPSVNMDDLQDSRPVQESQSENMNDFPESQTVTGVLKADSCKKFFNAFTESKEMFNVFIRKADTRKQLGLQVY